jgi:hypothetical protein
METEREKIIRLAQELFKEKAQEGLDMSQGPCLSEEIVPDWCVDVAHSPREEVDNLPQNQCRSYRSGQVHHFVELDLDGNLIRAR